MRTVAFVLAISSLIMGAAAVASTAAMMRQATRVLTAGR